MGLRHPGGFSNQVGLAVVGITCLWDIKVALQKALEGL